MKLLKLMLIAILAGFFHVVSISQNFINNGSFESGTDVPYGADENTTVEYLSDWIRAKNTEGSTYHSADWRYISNTKSWGYQGNYDVDYSNNNFTKIYFNPADGNGMIAMLHAELIQQKINTAHIKELLETAVTQQMTLRYKIRIPNSMKPVSSTKLTFYLSKNKLKYKKDTPFNLNHPDDYRKIDNNSSGYTAIFVDNNMTAKYPPGAWHQVEQTITLPGNLKAYDWIGIDMRSFASGDDKTGEYIYLDDIELTLACNSTCSQTSGPMQAQLYGNVIGSSNPYYTRISNLSNVHSLTFKVFAVNGDLVYTNSAYCPNGINHDIYWVGKNANGADLAIANYRYELTTTNDCYTKVLKGSITKSANYQGPVIPNFSQICETGSNLADKACCNLDLYKDNEILIGPGPTDYIVQRNIWACTKYPDFSDEVLIKSNADILFQAGNQVTLEKGFHTEPGAVFVAQIDPCEDSEIPGGNKLAGISSGSESSVIPKSVDESVSPIEIYPNPGNGLFTVKAKEMDGGSITIRNVLGAFINTVQMDKDKTVIDLTLNENGLYFFEITSKDFKKTYKVIKQ